MNTDIQGRVAMVAAASTGLGRAVAEGLAREGVHLALCSRDVARIETAAGAIRDSYGVRVLARAVDVSQPSAVEQFFADTMAEFGRLDICVTNAGGPPSKPFSATTIEEWRNAIDLNLMSHVLFAKLALPIMQRAGWGRFLMISSVSVKQPIDGLVLSNTARGAVPGLARSLANEYGPFGITVNNVCPGYTLTDRLSELAKVKALAQGVTPDEAAREWSAATALRRLARPAEFADAVVFLASERAAYITGQSLLVDGGFYKGSL
ncbi:MAG TPA: SDR family oxidoreductase [Terriglobales bacterium]|nr:SDR family oxidoreductase [Terriglobales bacterium]